MNIVKPYAKMIQLPSWQEEVFTPAMGIYLLQHIEWCARISHRSEDAMNENSWKRIIETVVLQHGDWSVVEHASVSVDAYVDRGITHEWVRHRLFSYTQESTRFVNYEKKMPPSFVDPLKLENQYDGKEGDKYWKARTAWVSAIERAEISYKEMLEAGYPPQIARSVFPNALASRIIVTGNLRNWRHFFIMRTTKETHPQMKEVSIPLLEEFKRNIPILYDDIEPNIRQIDSLKRAR